MYMELIEYYFLLEVVDLIPKLSPNTGVNGAGGN